MDNDLLDRTLRAALSGSPPPRCQERAARHFGILARRIREAGPPASSRWRNPVAWGWAAAALLGAGALSLALAAGLLGPAARAEVEFTGLLATSERTLFQLVDTTTGTNSGWIALREDFAGYTLSGYDPKSDLLTLTRDGAQRQVRLNDGRVRAAGFELSGAIVLDAGERLEVERATLVFDRENDFPLKNGLVFHLTPRLQPDGTIRYETGYDLAKAGGKPQGRQRGPTVIAWPKGSFSFQFPDPRDPGNMLQFSFTPRGD